MKVLIIKEPGKAYIEEVALPELRATDVLVKVRCAGICGTDISIYTGETNFVKEGLITYPIRIGHEWSGIVDKTGSAVKSLNAGDHVIGDNGISCGECVFCKKGQYWECPNIRSVGTINTWDGCFAEYILMPERHLYKLSEETNMENAALIEPMSIAYAGVKKCNISAESTVAVIGTGSIGLSAIAVAKSKGAKKVILIGRTKSKLDVGKSMGATNTVSIRTENAIEEVYKLTSGEGVDYIIEASGMIESINFGAEIVAKKGKIVLLGFYEKNLDGLNINRLVFNEISIEGIMGSFQAMKDSYELVSNTGLDLTSMITRRTKFIDIVSTLEEIRKSGKDIKVMVSFK